MYLTIDLFSRSGENGRPERTDVHGEFVNRIDLHNGFIASSDLIFTTDIGIVALYGDIFSFEGPGGTVEIGDRKTLLKSLHDQIVYHGFTAVCRKLMGHFVLAHYDRVTGTLLVASDQMGSLYCYWGRHADGLTVSTNLNSFLSGRFQLNKKWVKQYFDGNDSIRKETALANVYHLNGGTYLSADRCLQTGVSVYFSLELELRSAYENKLSVSEDEAAGRVGEILTENMRSAGRSHGTLGLFLSEGVDSVTQLTQLMKSDIPFQSYSRMFTTDRQDVFWSLHRKILQKFPHKNKEDMVDLQRCYDYYDQHDFSQPAPHSYHTILISKPRSIASVTADNIRCVISGEYGDYALLHRHRYHVFFNLFKMRGESTSEKLKQMVCEGSPEDEVMAYVQSLFSDYYQGKDYSFSAREITPKKILEFYQKYNADFISFFVEDLHLYRGISHTRDMRTLGNISVVDPYQDPRLFTFVFSLPDELIDKMTSSAILQRNIIMKESGEKLFQDKSENYQPSLRQTYCPLADDLHEAVCMLEQMGFQSALYYRKLLENSNGYVGSELWRVLTFYHWQQNWKKNTDLIVVH